MSTLHNLPQDYFQLSAAQVHIWQINLDQPHLLPEMQAILSTDEQQNANRFLLPIHRQRYIGARGMLRTLLARYLNCEPNLLKFSYGEHGKPSLAVPSTALQFNLSHSDDKALYAISATQPVGVDIESITKKVDIDAIAQRYFAPQEYAELQSLTEDEKVIGFFNAWTRKEAIIKATGQGLFLELNKVIVSLDPKQEARLIALDNKNVPVWVLQNITASFGYVAALAAIGQVDVVYKQWYND